MSEEILRIDHITKEYRLGMIGGTSLREEIQRKRAARKGLEDPTRQIGDNSVGKTGEKFLALNDVSLSVNQGERVGIIGHNGAGKSTLLKLISRITAPSTGFIEMNGRVASMLEVGTGFHPELTGRENIYLNGAILGMTKAEIDSKMEDIIEFSEVRQFIDTPVKRYSSGMYVKLAFSVAAHLDSEIMIMDEVLAVGDMAFQKKCLEKMSRVSKDQGRTILYVSHNMNTIRSLCERCIVLDHGTIVFDGNVEEAIAIYLGSGLEEKKFYDLAPERDASASTENIVMNTIELLNESNMITFGEKLQFKLSFTQKEEMQNLHFRFCIYLHDMTAIATSMSEKIDTGVGENECSFEINTSCLAPSKYILKIIALEPSEAGSQIRHDVVKRALAFEVVSKNQLHNFEWDAKFWGNCVLPDAATIE